ncbi:alpha/beta fold hydrolase [Fructilactobacillus florum]|uniref:alpha/beta fold hydrolase n=1 Tax=Fructilactobacillus florum TaxID=640331 RepID=UPI00028BEDC8|nr:alpha/beta fold hydrolase [Fructilactobacillus florum]EKK21030.1 Alpha, beta superfamily hydrolase [Fructilactobacillus florum 2F]
MISYQIVGQGVPIVFIHGLALDRTSMRDFFEPLLKGSGLKRYYVDLPGMGNSPGTPQADVQTVLAALVTFIKAQLDNEKFVVCGHSFGGYLASFLTKTFGSQIRGIFLTCPVVKAHKEERVLAQHVTKPFGTVNYISHKEFKTDFLAMNVKIGPRQWDLYQQLIIPGLQRRDAGFIETLQRNYQLEFESDLPRFISPQTQLMILVGRHDQIVGFQQQLELGEQVKNSTVVLLQNAGRNLFIDEEMKTAAYFKGFLQQLLVK